MVSASSWLDRLTARELAVYKKTGSVSRSSLYEMKKSFRTLCNEFEGLKGPQFLQGGKPPKMILSNHGCRAEKYIALTEAMIPTAQ